MTVNYSLYSTDKEPIMDKKPWYKSKTLLVNVVTLAGVLCGWATGVFEGNEQALATIATVQGIVNVLLRVVTKAPLGA
jgi:hypothetical protein